MQRPRNQGIIAAGKAADERMSARPVPASVAICSKVTPMSMNIEAMELAVHAPVLTPTEKSCLLMIAEGRKFSEISALLALSEPDVETALAGIEEKLGASNRLHAVSIAMRKGLIEVEESKPDQAG
jgi:DNA-binding CsgD family transcriptional regulator